MPCLPEPLPPSPATAAPTKRARPCPGPAPSPLQCPFSPSREPWFSCVHSPHSLPQCRVSIASHCPCPGLAVPCLGPACYAHPALLPPAVTSAPPLYHFLTTDMVRTRDGSHLRPRVRFSTPEQAEQAPVSAAVPEPVLEEPQGFRRYQTRMGPRAPSPVPQRRSRRARPSKRARTSGPGESSSFRPQPSPSTPAPEETSSP